MLLALKIAITIAAALPFTSPANAAEAPQKVPAGSVGIFDATGKELDGARGLLMSSPSRALKIAQAIHEKLAKTSSEMSGNPDRIIMLARADWLTGAAFVQLNRIDEALAVIDRGLASGIAQAAPNSKIEGDLLLAKSQALSNNGHVEQALPVLLRAYAIYTSTHQARSQSIALQNIGSMYMLARDFDRALKYYRQADDAFKGDPSLMVSLYNNRAGAYLEQGRAALAEQDFRLALEQADKMGSPVLRVRLLGSVAQAQMQANKLDQARATINQALQLSHDVPIGDWRQILYGTAAQIAVKQGDTQRATYLIETAFSNVDLAHVIVVMRDALHTGYVIYRTTGNYSRALQYLEAYQRVDDEARTVAASTSAALMAARFDYANQNLKIAQRDATIATASARLRNTVLKGIAIGGGLIFGLLLFGYISIRRSRNEVRAANADLSQSNTALEKALAARTEFLAMTSHEIRTPLNGILGMTQVLLADRAIEPNVRGKIELVQGAGETMKALVDDLLDVAKMATGEVAVHQAPFDLARLLRDAGEVWAGQAQTRGLALALDIDAAPVRLVGDEVRLRQIVFNLMSNAIKFTDRGEVRLTVSTLPVEAGGEERLRIAIADTGIGIPPDQAEEIFESFRQIDSGTTRRHGGTGLGLSICRSLARALGGDVTLASIVGAGSTFTLDLPLIRAVAEPASAAPAVAAAGLAGARLLLVEANPLSQSVLRAVLTPHVATLAVAPGGDEAAGAIDRGGIDLVLADGATLGLDMGIAAALGRAAAARGARFVLLWPTPDEGVYAAAGAAGLAEPVAKPIAAPDLVAALHKSYRNVVSPERASCAA